MINKIVITAALSFSLIMSSFAELVPVGDDVLNEVSGQSGITLNAKIILGDESSFVFTNTSGKKKADATAGETGYLIVDELQGALEFEGLGFDLVSDLKNSGKSAIPLLNPVRNSGLYFSPK